MNQSLIFGPVFAMMLLVCIVGVLTFRERVRQYKSMRLHPQKAPTRKEFSAAMQDMRCADNLMNLFEVPMMFYVACIGLYVTKAVDWPALLIAWGYVFTRYGHSYVHCGSNIVMKRFKWFVASDFVLIALWLLWGFRLVSER